jgi:hypothetical protein
MATLRNTEDVLAEWGAIERTEFGQHMDQEVMTAPGGMIVGETKFNPARDAFANPFSVMERITGVRQTFRTLPNRALHPSIIVHQPVAKGYDQKYGVGAHRRQLARLLGRAIEDAMPGMSDYTYNYAIGEMAVEAADRDTEVLDTSGDPEQEVKKIAEISSEGGLTFVITDGLNLPLHNQPRVHYPYTVAIKANAPSDRAVRQGGLVWRSGVKTGEVNTSNLDDVQENSDLLERQHMRVAERLQCAGIAVASVVLAREAALGFDVTAADRAIAAAIRQVMPK